MTKIYNSSDFHFEQVLSHYLWGQAEIPADITDSFNILKSETTVKYSLLDYMQNGAGRFVNGQSFSVIGEFFGANDLTADVYTKEDIFNYFGYYTNNVYGGVIVNQANISDGVDDALDRINIFNTTGFQISENTLFVIDDDGNKYISNFAIVPIGMKDNYDFVGGTGMTNLFNEYYKNYLDPSSIGKKVTIEFDGDNKVTSHYDFNNWLADGDVQATWNHGVNTGILPYQNAEVDRLFRDGPTRFIDDDGRAVVYVKDSEWYTKFNSEIRSDSYIKSFADDVGITFVTKTGENSYISGTAGSDHLIGSSGYNSFGGGYKQDPYIITSSDGKRDILEGRDGFDRYEIFIETASVNYTPKSYPVSLFPVSAFNNVDVIDDSDGQGIITLYNYGFHPINLSSWKLYSPDNVIMNYGTGNPVYELDYVGRDIEDDDGNISTEYDIIENLVSQNTDVEEFLNYRASIHQGDLYVWKDTYDDDVEQITPQFIVRNYVADDLFMNFA